MNPAINNLGNFTNTNLESPTSHHKNSRHVFIRWLGYLRPYVPYLILAYFLMLVVMGIDIILPKVIGFVIDVMLKGSAISAGSVNLPLAHSQPIIKAFIIVLGVLLGLLIVRVGTIFCRNLLFVFTGEKVHIDIRKQLFDHLQRLPISYFDRSYTGRIMARLTTDTDALWHLLNNGSLNVIAPAITVVAVLCILFTIHVWLASMALLIVPIVAVLFLKARKDARVATKAQRETVSDIYSRLQEQISGIRLVRIFGRSSDESASFKEDLFELYQKNMDLMITFGKLSVKSELATGTATALVLCLGGIAVVAGQISIGELIQFYIYCGMLFSPLQQITNTSAQVFTTAEVALERIFEMLDQPMADEVASGGRPCIPLHGHISIQHVSFEYDKNKPVLEDITLSINAGEIVALVGPSGVGKSTLVNLLCRFYKYSRGSISIDGHDIKEFEVESYRRQISYVAQDNFMFTGTIADNIRYANPDATQADIEAVAKMANAHDFIMHTPHGYDTELGERGVTLSGGQKQRLNIARALIRHPRILIMDEPTSALDAESESIILEALETVFKKLTCIIIAHRLSTVMNADKIFVFNEGKLAQQGTHRELFKAPGVYQDLCRKQFVGFGGSNPELGKSTLSQYKEIDG